LTLISVIAIAIVGNLLIFVSLPSHNLTFFTLNIALTGIGIVPIASVCYGFAVELTFPTPEHVSNGILILPAKIYTTLLGLLIGYLSENYSPMYAVAAFLMNSMISLIGAFYIKEDLRRLKFKLDQSL
jgi:hypothetical protein